MDTGVAFVDDVRVDFVGDDEELVFLCDLDDFLEEFAGVYSAGGVVGGEEEYAGDGVIVFDALANVVDVGHPSVVGGELVGDV